MFGLVKLGFGWTWFGLVGEVGGSNHNFFFFAYLLVWLILDCILKISFVPSKPGSALIVCVGGGWWVGGG